jgi:hypothetical protein
MTKNPFAEKRLLGMPIEGHDMPIETLRWIGRFQMVIAPIFLIVVICMVFGAFGPVQGISTIQLH